VVQQDKNSSTKSSHINDTPFFSKKGMPNISNDIVTAITSVGR
jgi:hypothetical protein